ncbi:MAG TPA: PPC domain-containing protein, partial [Thermoguttaceae bacterium]|nr:PPC domain-containing protein [Thermoguttaceae bacterium]
MPSRTLRVERLEDRRLLSADVFEPNDSLAEAFDLVAGAQTHLGLTIHEPDNDDWYKWTATNSGTLGLDLQFTHASGDLDLQLVDAGGGVLTGQYSSDDNEHLVWDAAAGETYYFHVYGYSGATNDYTLEIEWPFPLLTDALEPNDSFAVATDLGQGDQTRSELTIHRPAGQEFGSNDDWFRWRAPATGTLSVSTLFSHALGDVDMDFLDSGQVVQAASHSSTDNEFISWSVTAGETYYVHVFGYNGATNPRYTLVIDGPDIAADFFEPNDSFAAAADLGQGDQTHAQLTIHAPNNDDWFRWRATATGTLSVSALFSHAPGDVDLDLLDSGQVVRASSNSSTDNEFASWTVTAGETYYIRVFGYSGATNPDYTLEIDGPDIPPDDFEMNDSFAAATILGRGDQTHAGLTIHTPGDTDWYQWTASASGMLTIDLLFSHAQGDLDAALLAGGETLLTAATSITDNEHLAWQVTAGQTYAIEVYGAGGATNPDYTLLIDGPEISPDSFEPNGSLETA